MSLNIKEGDRAKKLVWLKQIIGAGFVFIYNDSRFLFNLFCITKHKCFVFPFFCENKDQPNENK